MRLVTCQILDMQTKKVPVFRSTLKQKITIAQIWCEAPLCISRNITSKAGTVEFQ